jgi:hypothetical protein
MRLRFSALRHSIVADGRNRAVIGAQATLERRRAEIIASLEEQYAARLAEAGLLQRTWIRTKMRRQIRREMRREMEKVAPRRALYAKR